MPNGPDIKKLEKKITDLSDALANLNSGDDLRRLILLIRKPGWTTPAEYLFATGIIDSMTAQVKGLAQTKTALLKGSQAVAPQRAQAATAAGKK